MDGLTKAENLRVRRLPLGFSMYLTSETERLVRELPEEIWADVMIPEEGKGYIKTILAARPDIAPQPYSDPILEHNSAFNWKSLFPPECDLPESVSGAVGDAMEERTETQEELQPQGTSEQGHTPGLEQVTSTVDESHLEPPQFELPTIYQTVRCRKPAMRPYIG
jgi:hypothetical protein